MKRRRVKTRAAKTLVRIPMDKVTAKPLMGPVPNSNRIKAVISVVTFASRTVKVARL